MHNVVKVAGENSPAFVWPEGGFVQALCVGHRANSWRTPLPENNSAQRRALKAEGRCGQPGQPVRHYSL